MIAPILHFTTRREAPAPGAVCPGKSPTTAKPPFPGSREWGLISVVRGTLL